MKQLLKSLEQVDKQSIVESDEILLIDTFIKDHAKKHNHLEGSDKNGDYVALTGLLIQNRSKNQAAFSYSHQLRIYQCLRILCRDEELCTQVLVKQ